MLVAPAYHVGENCVGSVLAALAPSNPPKATKMDVNELNFIIFTAMRVNHCFVLLQSDWVLS